MSRDKDLIAEIEKLNPDSETKGLKTETLEALLKELQDDKAVADKEAADKEAADKLAADKAVADKDAADKKAADKAAAEKKKYPHEVSKGCSITTKRGLLDAGEGIEAKDLAGGKEAFDLLVKRNKITKR